MIQMNKHKITFNLITFWLPFCGSELQTSYMKKVVGGGDMIILKFLMTKEKYQKENNQLKFMTLKICNRVNAVLT